MLSVDSLHLEYWPQISKEMDVTERELGDYIRVSLPSQPFGSKLDVPTPPTWPFDHPKGFSDEDITGIVDAVHMGVKANPPTGRVRFDPSLPIYSIDGNPNGDVTVMTGSVQGPLAGGGEELCCRKQDGQWVIVATGMWAS